MVVVRSKYIVAAQSLGSSSCNKQANTNNNNVVVIDIDTSQSTEDCYINTNTLPPKEAQVITVATLQ